MNINKIVKYIDRELNEIIQWMTIWWQYEWDLLNHREFIES